MRSNWRVGKWRGIPILVHWTVLLWLPWSYFETRSASAMAISFAAFMLILLTHELGHAAVAIWREVRVRRIELFFIHGRCTHELPDYEEDDVLIAWGGVAAQFVLILVALTLGQLLAAVAPVAHKMASPLFRTLIQGNFVIIVFNLIPVAPLDGAKAWQCLPLLRERWQETSWSARLRGMLSARRRAREKKLEARSKQVADEIIERLRKSKSDNT